MSLPGSVEGYEPNLSFSLVIENSENTEFNFWHVSEQSELVEGRVFLALRVSDVSGEETPNLPNGNIPAILFFTDKEHSPSVWFAVHRALCENGILNAIITLDFTETGEMKHKSYLEQNGFSAGVISPQDLFIPATQH